MAPAQRRRSRGSGSLHEVSAAAGCDAPSFVQISRSPSHIGEYDKQEQRGENEGKRGAVAKLHARIGLEERVERQRMGGVAWPATCHDENHVQRIGYPDGPQ